MGAAGAELETLGFVLPEARITKHKAIHQKRQHCSPTSRTVDAPQILDTQLFHHLSSMPLVLRLPHCRPDAGGGKDRGDDSAVQLASVAAPRVGVQQDQQAPAMTEGSRVSQSMCLAGSRVLLSMHSCL